VATHDIEARVGLASEAGWREENEDYAGWREVVRKGARGRALVAVVADGLGGLL